MREKERVEGKYCFILLGFPFSSLPPSLDDQRNTRWEESRGSVDDDRRNPGSQSGKTWGNQSPVSWLVWYMEKRRLAHALQSIDSVLYASTDHRHITYAFSCRVRLQTPTSHHVRPPVFSPDSFFWSLLSADRPGVDYLIDRYLFLSQPLYIIANTFKAGMEMEDVRARIDHVVNLSILEYETRTVNEPTMVSMNWIISTTLLFSALV